jgi:hypothetical protein
MSKFGGGDYILVVQDRKGDAATADKPAITYDSKQIITDSASSYAKSKNIPIDRCFSTRRSETENGRYGKGFSWNWNRGKFSALSPTSFLRVTQQNKLFIFAHGNDFGISFMSDDGLRPEGTQAPINPAGDNAVALASMLKAHGLSEVGLITFKSCFVGRGYFLNNFASALAMNGIRAGWLKGYKGAAATVEKPGGGVTEEITRNGKVLVDGQRLKIIRGPGLVFEGQTFGRYAGQTSPSDLKTFALLED